MERERVRGGGVAGGEGRVEGVDVPDPVPPPIVPIEEPRAESELRIVLAEAVRPRYVAESKVGCEGEMKLDGALLNEAEGGGEDARGIESG